MTATEFEEIVKENANIEKRLESIDLESIDENVYILFKALKDYTGDYSISL
jgi:hypothetical protein